MNTTSGQTTVSIVDSVIAFNGRNGVWGDVSSAADLALGIERTSVIGNAEDGIRLQTSTGPLRATVARNAIERNGFNGIEMIGQSISADLVATITDNSISANGADGIHCAGNGPNISYAYVSRNAVNGQSFAFDIGANCAFGSYNDNTGTGGINGTTNVVTAF
jgi:hypothetical protein